MKQQTIKDYSRKTYQDLTRKLYEKWKDVWNANCDQNAAQKCAKFTDLKGSGSDKDAILCSFGPSLEKSIGVVKRAYDAGHTIYSAARAYPYLRKHGIKPHFTFLCDPIKGIEHIGGEDTPLEGNLVCTVTSNPEIPRRWVGDKYFFFSKDILNLHEYYVKRFRDINPQQVCNVLNDAGGIVANLMVIFGCTVTGSRRLLLVGYDFCWHKGFYPGEEQRKIKEQIIHHTWDGKKCYTTDKMIWLAGRGEALAIFLSNVVKTEIIDCTKGGLLGNGFIKKGKLQELLNV